jgi:dTDP-glucose 4,6-dehydratase
MCKNFDELTGNVDSQNLISFVKDRAGHDFRYSINHDKITTDLGWWPVYSFEDSINETIKYYIKKYEL